MNLKERMSKGERICGTMLRIERNPAVAFIAKNAGLDFFMFDCEHSNFHFQVMHDAFLMARALNIHGMLRVPNLSKDYISRAIDAGASGVMVPMIETVEQARELVKWAKYAPIGERGFTAVGAHTGYLGGATLDLMDEANRSILAIAQIETRLGVENAYDIASIEGIDAIIIGPNDLSISLGVPGKLDDPIELEAIAKVAAACKKAGKFFGLHSGEGLSNRFSSELNIVMQGLDCDFLKVSFERISKYCNSLPPMV